MQNYAKVMMIITINVLQAGLGKINREPRTEPKIPRTETKSTDTENFGSLFSSHLSGTEILSSIRFWNSINRRTELI